jgi:hypothetical protein
MNKFLLGCALVCSTQLCVALAPYAQGTKLAAADLSQQITLVDKKLTSEGFTVVGHHAPTGLVGRATVVVTDPGMQEAIRTIGGAAIVASGIRVAVQADGSVSYMNPDYWYRAYLRSQFKTAQVAASSVKVRLTKALGAGADFGGDVPEADLPNYRYMLGMERFDSGNSELKKYASFDEALKAVQSNLNKGLGSTSRVYEVVLADSKQAVFGVAMNNPGDGEAWWVNKIGAEHMAGLPYEVFIVDNQVFALYARYRIALAWPALGMGQFMGIINAPDAIRKTLAHVAGSGD